jgi:N-acetylglucosamine kinase-like BadF-type ATPase
MSLSPEPRAGYVIGVDGGQTKTLTALATTDGTIRALARTGPCNHVHEPGGKARQYRALRDGYEQVLQVTELVGVRAQAVTIGVSGSGDRPTVESVYDGAPVALSGDLPTALAGAIPSNEGIIVIGGTGSAAYGRNVFGVEARAGGQGYYCGDEGGGSDIARRAFKAIYQADDGRAPATALTELILEHYEVPTLALLRNRIYGDLTRDELAQAAALVGRAAAEGDAVAIGLLAYAGRELGRLVVAVANRLEWGNVALSVGTIGSVFRSGELVTGPLRAELEAVYPQARLQMPRFEPVVGAVLLALRSAGYDADETMLARLDRSYAAALARLDP